MIDIPSQPGKPQFRYMVNSKTWGFLPVFILFLDMIGLVSARCFWSQVSVLSRTPLWLHPQVISYATTTRPTQPQMLFLFSLTHDQIHYNQSGSSPQKSRYTFLTSPNSLTVLCAQSLCTPLKLLSTLYPIKVVDCCHFPVTHSHELMTLPWFSQYCMHPMIHSHE